MHAGARHSSARQAFTLVELLTVVVIISILVALTVGAAIYVRARVKTAAAHAELKELERALMNYSTEYKAGYPPDFFGLNGSAGPGLQSRAIDQIRLHLRARWPRYAPGADPYAQMVADLANNYGIDATRLDPASALVFWLGGLPEVAGEPVYQPAGFHADPAHPFQPGRPRIEPLYNFNPNRIRVTDTNGGRLHYYPDGFQSSPVVYFRAQRDPVTGRFEYGAASGNAFSVVSYPHAGLNVATPYLEAPFPGDPAVAATPRRWRNPETFQIIHPGLDGLFSGWRSPGNTNPIALFRYSRSGQGFSDRDFDNITNFVMQLEDEIQ